MSQFKVDVRAIDTVSVHPNADRLEICRVKGLDYQFVYAKGVLHPDDLVVYFPVDSLIVPELIEVMGLTGKLSGHQRNRVKTIALRGAISQGVVIPIDKIHKYLQDFKGGDQNLEAEQQDLTELLDVKKYIPPEIPCHCGNLVPLPDGVPKYDLEGCDNHPDIVELLMELPVLITEKVEGTNFSITYNLKDGSIRVNQHGYSIVEVPVEGKENSFWKIARNENLIDLARDICKMGEFETTTIFGEMIGWGIQDNIYKLRNHKVLFYDILGDHKWVSAFNKIRLFTEAEGREDSSSTLFVPVLSIGMTLKTWLCGRSVKEASNGKSQLYDGLREGIVITPMNEQWNPEIGRLILKQRDPIYLSGHDT